MYKFLSYSSWEAELRKILYCELQIVSLRVWVIHLIKLWLRSLSTGYDKGESRDEDCELGDDLDACRSYIAKDLQRVVCVPMFVIFE